MEERSGLAVDKVKGEVTRRSEGSKIGGTGGCQDRLPAKEGNSQHCVMIVRLEHSDRKQTCTMQTIASSALERQVPEQLSLKW